MPFFAKNDLEAPLLPKEEEETAPVAKAMKRLDDDDDDDDDDDQSTVINGDCNLVNKTYFVGFVLGAIVQYASLCSFAMMQPDANGNVDLTKVESSASTVFALYFFARYWVFAALIVPPFVTTLVQKYCRRRSVRAGSSTIKRILESYFECVRFQMGMFFGSLILLSLINFYALATTAPICMLLAYYAICVVVSFFALCLLQVFVDQICANVSSVEIVVSYEDEDDETNYE